ncbi:S-adenosyl-L-methionine-dependent methyltransferase [Xylariales sp. PMI_506]|nr:S-adenosyl-L-methionine-dependent methyltransferase [Xylariales sp. PMI_506]
MSNYKGEPDQDDLRKPPPQTVDEPWPASSLPTVNTLVTSSSPAGFFDLSSNSASYSNFQTLAYELNNAADWENHDRPPTGNSVIDVDSVVGDSGRTYQGYKEGTYFLPNDAAEQDRLDMQHAGTTLLLDDKLYLAPIENPKYVLDIATGTGIWALQFAEQHPNSHVIGTDLSDIQPKSALPNCTFVREDSEELWLFGTSEEPTRFDYIHLRYVFSCFNRPREVMKQAYQNLKPGGWIEYCDITPRFFSVNNNIDGTAPKRWSELMAEGLAKNGRDGFVTEHLHDWMLEEGFVDVVEKKFFCPVGTWPREPRLKKVGQFMAQNLIEGFRGIGWMLFKAAGLTPDEIERLTSLAKEEIVNPRYRWFYPTYVIYGRKPLHNERT